MLTLWSSPILHLAASNHFMSIQKLTDAIPPPCTELLSDFPLRPKLLGNLLLQQGMVVHVAV